jgi:adenosyl cobinamide kinase/adenosyl cobinamide phosphate guanylyltransferase
MAENILILCGAPSPAEKVSSVSRDSGSTLGLVNTCLDPAKMQISGKRIEELRTWGGATYHAFDEPLAVGSAIAQLAGYADAVVVDRLDDWAERLVRFHKEKSEYIDAEVTSVTSVLSARLADVVLVSRPPSNDKNPAAALHRRMLAEFGPHLTRTVDLSRG